ncbi:uncharacterized protein LOC121382367 [Gigantopelta aegis]|uniref:uncharacterized protein LOC121382367 n=1 Tax=Gigantopelta aegis TaxID=1735272 RepID=UPI001B88E65F|nr:uncharacterized protein LOC121382367 [Gigantopelta aegis]
MAIKVLILALLLVTTSHGRPIARERTMEVVTGSNSAAVGERPKRDVIGKYSRKRRFQAYDELHAVIARLRAIDITSQRKKPKAESSVVIKVDKNVNVHVVHQDSTKNSQQGLQADDPQSVHIQHDSPQRATISLKLEHKHPSDGQQLAEDASGKYPRKRHFQDHELAAIIARLEDINIEQNNPKVESPVVIKVNKNVKVHVVHQGSIINAQGLQADDHQSVHIQQDSPQEATISHEPGT